MFHANYVKVEDREMAIPADFTQFICARGIFLKTSNLDEPLFRFIMERPYGTGNSLEYFDISSDSESNQGEFCEFIVKVNFEIHF
jgi:hypothetical protein